VVVQLREIGGPDGAVVIRDFGEGEPPLRAVFEVERDGHVAVCRVGGRGEAQARRRRQAHRDRERAPGRNVQAAVVTP
jgi:hypothetical protein